MRSLPLLAVLATFAACGGEKGIIVYNSPPAASIIDPAPGTVFNEGDPIRFFGQVDDDGGVENLTVQWTSSIDGTLVDEDPPDPDGYVDLETASLSQGTHVITLRVTDEEAQQGEASVDITINDVPELPSIQVVRPQSTDRGIEGFAYVLQVKVSDAQDPAEQLIVQADANPGGFLCFMVPDGGGNAQCETTLPIGQYLLTFSVEDLDGNAATARATYQVVSPDDYDADGDGYSPNAGDCNDSASQIYPGAPELCDGLDNDCNPNTGIDIGSACYDDDGDGYCEQPPCTNATSTEPDCNDNSPSISPAGVETRNNIDDNCNGQVDEGTSAWDNDGDGFCSVPPCANAAGAQSDCNDTNAQVYPGNVEICGDGVDNNCNSQLNERNAIGCVPRYYDQDGDTYGVAGGSECWCDAGQAPYTGTNTNDCYDGNPDVHPGQTAYFIGQRGDGQYDYNCDGSWEARYYGLTGGCEFTLSPFSCDLNGAGWVNFEPGCGMSGQWIEDCQSRYDAVCILFQCIGGNPANCPNCWDCDNAITPRAQQCR